MSQEAPLEGEEARYKRLLDRAAHIGFGKIYVQLEQ